MLPRGKGRATSSSQSNIRKFAIPRFSCATIDQDCSLLFSTVSRDRLIDVPRDMP
jgi:hypothetical protein